MQQPSQLKEKIVYSKECSPMLEVNFKHQNIDEGNIESQYTYI